MSTGRKNQGFTLVELMVTLTAASIMISLAALSLGRLAPSFSLDNGTMTTAMVLKEARMQAINRGHTVTVVFSGNDFTVTDSVDGAVLDIGEVPSSVAVAADGAISFSSMGIAGSPVTVAVSNSAGARDIYVEWIGEVQIQ
jgi:prepilin-type N-terminal cleavage/methylation domain-containing protein